MTDPLTHGFFREAQLQRQTKEVEEQRRRLRLGQMELLVVSLVGMFVSSLDMLGKQVGSTWPSGLQAGQVGF